MQLASPPTIQFNCTTRLLKDPSLSKVRMIVFAMRYEQEMAVKTFKQGSLSNAAFMEKLNTRFDVAKSVGVDFGWHNLWEHCAKQTHKKSYDMLTIGEMEEVREDAEERYLAYLMIHNSSSLHETL